MSLTLRGKKSRRVGRKTNKVRSNVSSTEWKLTTTPNPIVQTHWAVHEFAAADLGEAPVVFHLDDILQGTYYNNRLTTNVFIEKIDLFLHFTPSTVDAYDDVRVGVYMFHAPDWDDGQVPATCFEPLDFNLAYPVFDKTLPLHVCGGGTGIGGSGRSCVCRIINTTVPLKVKVHYEGDAGDNHTSSPSPGLYMISDSGGTPHPSVNGYYRLYWKDLFL